MDKPGINVTLMGKSSQYPLTYQYRHRHLYAFLIENNIPIGSSCKGDGICKKCVITLIEGDFSPVTELEKKFLGSERLQKGERLACQCAPLQDATISTTYW